MADHATPSTAHSLFELVEQVPLVCPTCSSADANGNYTAHALHPTQPFSLDEALDGTLFCENSRCGRLYPVVDGVPFISSDLARLLTGTSGLLLERDIPSDLTVLLQDSGIADPGWKDHLTELSFHVDDQWGDRVSPPAPPQRQLFGSTELLQRIQARTPAPVPLTIVLGSSVGRLLLELAPATRFAVGLDPRPALCRRANRLLRGKQLPFARLIGNDRYEAARVAGAAAPNALSICSPIFPPPVAPRWFDRVVAIDFVEPAVDLRRTLQLVDAFCARGGELLLTASLHPVKVDGVTRPGRAPELRELLTTRHALPAAEYVIEEEAELPRWYPQNWRAGLMQSAGTTYYIRARKHR